MSLKTPRVSDTPSKEANHCNGAKLRHLGSPVIKVSGRITSLPLGNRGAKMTPTHNSSADIDFVSDIRRDVVDLAWAEGAGAPALPDFVIKNSSLQRTRVLH